MDTSLTDYLNTLDFPKLIEEKSIEDCFEHFCQDYDLLLKSFELNLSPLSEKSANQYLINALLRTLAERESLLRREINQILQVLIPAPENDKKRGAKNQQLDEIIFLFGMSRQSIIDKESEVPLYETDEAIKKRLSSRLGILSKTGTKTAYTHNFLLLEPSLKDIAIIQNSEKKELDIFLLPKVENKTETWFKNIESSLKSKINQKDIIPIRDKYTLVEGIIEKLAVHITYTVELTSDNEKKTTTYIKKICKDYFDKKYKFHTVISVSELLSNFTYPLIEKLEIKLKQIGKNNHIEFLECRVNQAPLLEKLTIAKK